MKVGNGYTLEEERKKERANGEREREQTLVLSRSPSSHFFFMFTLDIRSVEFAFIIYLKIGIHWANKQRECFSVHPPGESRGVERENFCAATMALRESTGIEVRLLQRGKNVAHPPQVRVIKLSREICLSYLVAISKKRVHRLERRFT